MSEDSQSAKGRMPPGIAAICLFLIILTTANVYAALTGAYQPGFTKYSILALCTLLAAGIYGLLRLQKWGWALVTAGCLLFSTGDFYFYYRMHAGFFLIRGLFLFLFFLYLIRQETRERLN